MPYFGSFNFSSMLIRPFTVTKAVEENGKEQIAILGQSKYTVVPGLTFKDSRGVLAASKSGWIMSLSAVMQMYDDGELHLKIHSRGRACEKIMKTVLIGILTAQKKEKRQLSLSYHEMSEEDRYNTAIALMKSLFNLKDESSKKKAEEAFEKMMTEGVVVVEGRQSYEKNMDQSHENAKKYIKRIADETGIVIPVLLTGTAIRRMSIKHDLLGNQKGDETISFTPIKERMSSTRIQSGMQESLSSTNDRVAALTLDQSSISNHLNVLTESTINEENPELTSVQSALDDTIQETAEINAELTNLRSKHQELEHATREELIRMQNEVSDLNSELRAQTEALETQQRTANDLEDKSEEQKRIIKEKDEELFQLKSSLQHQSKKSKREAAKLKRENQSIAEEYDSQMREITLQIGVTNTRNNELKKKIKQLELKCEEHTEKNQELLDCKQKIEVLELKVKEEQDLQKDLVNSCSKIRKLSSSFTPTPKKGKRRASEVTKCFDIFDSESESECDWTEPVKRVNALTAKDVYQFLKCDKTNIHDLWNHLEDVKKQIVDNEIIDGSGTSAKITEKSFMSYIKLKLPLEQRHIYDRLSEGDQEDFKKSRTAIIQALDDDPGEYLYKFNSATKRSDETYTAFSIRLISYYLKGHGEPNSYQLKDRDQQTLVQGFLMGIDQTSAASIRLVATDDEMKDVQKLAKRAHKLVRSRGRSAPPITNEGSKIVNNTQTISEESIVEKLFAKLNNLKNNGSQRHANNPNRDRNYRSKAKDKCNKCGKLGHWARECYSKVTKEDKEKENKASKFCSYCRKSNHTIENCWSRKKKDNTIANILGEREERRIRLETSENDRNHQPQIDILVKDPETNESKTMRVLADSGASLTCGNSRLEFFKNIPKKESAMGVSVANGAKMKVAGQCVIDVKVGDTLIKNITVTLIDDLQYQMILGNNLLLSVGFKMHKGGKFMDIGQEKNLPVYGVNQLRKQEHSVCTTYEDDSLSLNSLTETNQSLSNLCPMGIDHTQRIPLKRFTSNSTLACGKQCETREKQGIRGVNATEISKNKIKEEATVDLSYIKLKEDQTDLTGNEKEILEDMLVRTKDVFSKSEYDIGKFTDKNGKTAPLKIKVINENGMINVPPRRVPFAHREWLESHLIKLEENEVIEKVTGDTGPCWNSPLLIVPKGNNRYRKVIDFRAVNKQIVSETYPLPNTRDCLIGMEDAKFFAAIDIRHGFFQMEIAKESRRYLGFSYDGVQYVYKRMPNGLNLAPSVFCRIISTMFRDNAKEIKKFARFFIDDIFIFSKTLEEHIGHIEQILGILHKHGMKINFGKSSFGKNLVTYLGFDIGIKNGKTGIRPKLSKIDSLLKISPPKTAKECKGFLGAVVFYAPFYKNIQQILKPLYQGASKKEYVYTEEMNKSFETAKELLSQKVLLHFPNQKKIFILRTDASDIGVGGSLSQKYIYEDKDEKEELLLNFSRSFNTTELRWSTMEKELCAFKDALANFRVYLAGRKFIYESDNKSLVHMIKNIPKGDSRTQRKLQRWWDMITSYDFEICHRPGDSREMALPDYLSRHPTDKEDYVVLNIKNFERAGVSLEEWKAATKSDESLRYCRGKWKRFKKSITEVDGLCYIIRKSGHKLAVPSALKNKLLWYYHHQYTLHGGYTAMIEAICKLFVFPSIHRAIRKYISNCEECAKAKNLPLMKSKRQHTSTPCMPGEYAEIDLVGPISKKPTSNNNRYILSYIDLFTGWVCLRAIPSKHSSNVVEALSTIFCEVGVPMNIQSDCGREFISALFKNCMERLGIRLSFSSPYHPQSQGRLERKHKDIAVMLRLLEEDGRSWDMNLAYIAYKLNTKVDPVTRITPWKLFHGFEAREPEFVNKGLTESNAGTFSFEDNTLQHWEEELTKIQQKTFENTYEQKLLQKENWALENEEEPSLSNQLEPGDRVYAKLPIIGGKLQDRMRGPYIVIKVSGAGTVVLRKESEEHGKTILLHKTKLKKIESDKSDLEEGRDESIKNQQESDTIPFNGNYNKNKKEKKALFRAKKNALFRADHNVPFKVENSGELPRRSTRHSARKSYTEYF